MLEKYIRLDTTENPYPPPQYVMDSVKNKLKNVNRYINIDEQEYLLKLLSKYSGVDRKHLILSPGSEIILREVTNAFLIRKNLVTLAPSFLPNIRVSKNVKTKIIKIRLNPPNFDLDPDLLIKIGKNSLIVIDNPNNPTGKNILDRYIIEEILGDKSSLLVIDEAYYEFSGMTVADLVEKYPNLAVTRTLDKAFGLAGLRIGYLIGGEYFTDYLSVFQYLMPSPSVYAAIEALENLEYMRRNVKLIIRERDRVIKELSEIGVKVYSSNTNFFLLETEDPDIVSELRDRGILVLNLSDIWLNGFIRVSIGTPEENNFFLAAIKKVLNTH